MASRLSQAAYTIGWIAALPIELSAAIVMLDEEHDPPTDFQKHPSDSNSYTWGRIGKHNIVMCALPNQDTGTSAAGRTASDLRASLPNIRMGLLVGIGGGVAKETVTDSVITVGYDIRLGDVVVSTAGERTTGVVQYDLRKLTIKNGETVDERKGFLGPAPVALQTAVTVVIARDEGYEDFLDMDRYPPRKRKKHRYPGIEKDPLKDAQGARAEADEDRDQSCAHYGTIASGNTVFKSAEARDAVLANLAKEGINPMCFEMEAAGLMNTFPCLVIRGISDYANGTKNDVWQGFASAAAAAYTKRLLMHVDPQGVLQATPLGELR